MKLLRPICAGLLCLLFILVADNARAAEPTAAAPLITPVDAAWTAALPSDPAAATQAYLDRLTPAARTRSDAYFEGGYWLQGWNLLVDLGIGLLLLATRASAWMRDRAERLTRNPFLQAGLYGAAWILVTTVLTAPLVIYQGYFHEHQYGFATQTFGPWLTEQLLSLGLTLVIGSVIVALFYTLVRRAPRSWWIGGSALAVLLLVLSYLIAPVLIDPLFNTYKSLEDGPVKASLLSMARANDVPATDILEFDASRQSTRVSANVSGIFGTASIRLNDNLLRRSSPAAIKAVTGHEMGHYVLNHIPKFIVEYGVLIVIGLAAVSWAFPRLQQRYGAGWGLRGVADPAGLPLLAMLFTVYAFLMSPVTNNIIRIEEVEADNYGLNVAREPDAIAEVMLTLTEYRKADPGKWEERVFFDHPSARQRIYAAMRWKAENPR